MLLLPIRPLQSTEVRRVDEITPHKLVIPRVHTSLSETNEDVRLTIGEDARRLAYGQGSSAGHSSEHSGEHSGGELPARSAAVVSAPASQVAEPEAGQDDGPLRGAALPFAFENDEPIDARSAVSEEPNALANRALRAFTFSGLPQTAPHSSTRESAFPEDEAGAVWDSEHPSKVPFEVFQRAVTDATPDAQTRGAAFSPLQSIFSPPENGGQPYGRPVPFEADEARGSSFSATSNQPPPDSTSGLSEEAVDELISELSWSLPEQHSGRPGTFAA